MEFWKQVRMAETTIEQQESIIELTVIGDIKSGFETLGQCPSSSRFNPNECIIELKQEFAEGLHNIELASHILVLYWFDRANRNALMRKTKPDQAKRGVFASRSPGRPNPIAVSVVKLLGHEGNSLRVSGMDCLDGTKVIDIKPYIPADDRFDDAQIKWQLPQPKN